MFDEFMPVRGDLVRSTRPNVDRPPPAEERERLGIVIERVPPGKDDNTWAVHMFRVLWSGPMSGPDGKLTLEPDHRLAIIY